MPIPSLNKLASGQVYLEPSPYPPRDQPSQILEYFDLTSLTLYLNQDNNGLPTISCLVAYCQPP
jgi:hypothetical protein